MENYQIKRLIYKNKETELFKCTHKGTNAPHILKRAPKKSNQINNQIKIHQELNSPYLVHYKQSFSTIINKVQYLNIVLEQCDGENIDHVIGNPRYDIVDIVGFMSDLCEAVIYLHQCNVMHRDIKAENVLLKRGKIKLSDFNISKKIQMQSNSKVTENIGTERYKAPQICNNKGYGVEVDIWCLGLLFLQLAAHDRLDNLMSGLKYAYQRDDFPNEQLMNKINNRTMIKLIKKMLRKDPKERIKIIDVYLQLHKLKRKIVKQFQQNYQQFVLPLIQEQITSKQELTMRVDEQKQNYPIQTIQLKTATICNRVDTVIVKYDDYRELITFVAWDLSVTYSYNLMPKQITERFINLLELYQSLKGTNNTIIIQTNATIKFSLLCRKQISFDAIQYAEDSDSQEEVKLTKQKPQKIEAKIKSISKNQQINSDQELYYNSNRNINKNDSAVSIQSSNHFIGNIQERPQFIKSYGWETNLRLEQQELHLNQEDYNRKIDELQRNKDTSPIQLAQQYLKFGLYLYQRKGENDQKQLIQHLLKGIKILQDKGQTSAKQIYIGALCAMGKTYFKLNKYQEAIKALQKALTHYDPKNQSHSIPISGINNQIGVIYYLSAKFDLAEKYFRKAFSQITCSSSDINKFLIAPYNNIALIYRLQSKYDQAITYFEQALTNQYVEQTGELIWIGKRLCQVYFKLKHFNKIPNTLETMCLSMFDDSKKQQIFKKQFKGSLKYWLQEIKTKSLKIYKSQKQKLQEIIKIYFDDQELSKLANSIKSTF